MNTILEQMIEGVNGKIKMYKTTAYFLRKICKILSETAEKCVFPIAKGAVTVAAPLFYLSIKFFFRVF